MPLRCPPRSTLHQATVAVLPWLLLACVVPAVHAASLSEYEASINDSDPWYDHPVFSPWAVAAAVVSVAIVVCGVVVIMGCADICQRHSGFKDFDNDAFSDNLSPVPAPSEFTMYPPIENTPDSISTSPVVFEPLPDITTRGRAEGGIPEPVRVRRVRPRISPETAERSDSVDSLDDLPPDRDSMSDQIRLQNLIRRICKANTRQQVPRGQLQYIKEMGAGWFGKVLQGEGHSILPGHRKTKVVIQMLREEPEAGDQLAFLEESLAYRDLDHHNVLKLLGQCVDTVPYLNILELCPFGDLKTYLRSHRVAMDSFNEKGLLLKFACDIAAGLQALHQEGYIHRDFATRNCMLASDLSVRVGDYGISEEVFKEDYYQDAQGDCLPIRWLAPECLRVTAEDVTVRRINKEANVWAYGVAMWEILSFGAQPYGDLTNNNVLRLVIEERTVRLQRPDVVVTHLDRLYHLMSLCWAEQPVHRPTLRELRIMLLHLLSRKADDPNSSAFDAKWNQLMPRRSPRVTRVQGFANGGVNTVSGPLQKHTPAPPRPSFLATDRETGEDVTSDLSQLNVSKLGLAGSHGSLDDIAAPSKSIHEKSIKSPVNEKSLEAEFSAANMRALEEANRQEDEVLEDRELFGEEEEFEIPAQQIKSNISAESGTLGQDSGIFSPIKAQKESISSSSEEASEGDQKRAASPEVATQSPDEIASPDIVINSPERQVRQAMDGDFFTSTPKKPDLRDVKSPESELYTTATGVSSSASTTVESSTPGYHTAQSYASQSSSERSMDLDDRSFMAPKKFADMLQTVAFTPSIDDEMLDASQGTGSPYSVDLSTEEDVFKSVNKTESEHSDDTPRNTPTPPLATSSLPLLDVDPSDTKVSVKALVTSAAPLLDTSHEEVDPSDQRDTDTPTPLDRSQDDADDSSMKDKSPSPDTSQDLVTNGNQEDGKE